MSFSGLIKNPKIIPKMKLFQHKFLTNDSRQEKLILNHNDLIAYQFMNYLRRFYLKNALTNFVLFRR